MRGTRVALGRVRLAELHPDLRGAFISAPRSLQRSGAYDVHLSGWVVGANGPVEAVEVWSGETCLHTYPVQTEPGKQPREIAELPHAATSGFRGQLGLAVAPRRFELRVVAVLDPDRRVEIGTIRGRRERWAPIVSAARSPLLITSLGRTGTTWLAHLLVQHPDVLAYPRYPYETCVGLYWAHALAVLAQPADERVFPSSKLQSDLGTIGANPYAVPDGNAATEWLRSGHVDELAAFARATIDGFYDRVARDVDKRGARYFVEKYNPGINPRVALELYPDARELILVRDFRDMYSSIRAFNLKRGYTAFGRSDAHTEEGYLAHLAGGAARLLADWKARSLRAHLVRYEDLVAAPAATLEGICAALGIAADPATVARAVEAAAKESEWTALHKTSDSTEASVGRWRTELPMELQEAATDAFREPLEAFGYET
jgi:hypothetical protein